MAKPTRTLVRTVTFSRRNLADIGLLLLVNLMWAAQYAAYKTASQEMGPVTLSTLTFFLAALLLLPFFLHQRRASARDSHSSESIWNGRTLSTFLMVAIVGLVPASAFLAWGTVRSTASNAALIYLTVPILTALMATAILGEKMTVLRWVSLALSLSGVLILSGIDWRAANLLSGTTLAGNGLVLVACASSAFYNVYSKKLLRRFNPLEVLIYSYLVAAVVSLPLVVWVEKLSPTSVQGYSAKAWFSLFVLSSMSWGLAMVLWMFLLKRLDVSLASISIYLLPFLGVLISAATLGERITPAMIVGGMVTLLGTVLVTSVKA